MYSGLRRFLSIATIEFRHQILTSKNDPRNERLKPFIMAVDLQQGIQMKQKELSKQFMMISN